MTDKRNLLNSVNSLSSDESDKNIQDPKIKIHSRNKSRAIRITYVIMFFTSVSYSIQMPSLWPYMNIINTSYTKEFLGWVVASYSLGQLVACPLFSYTSGKTGYFKLILLISSILAIGGNYLYAIIVDLRGPLLNNIDPAQMSLLASRIIIGIAGANVASIRLFLTLSTTEAERIGPMAILSACQGLGFIIGPGLQAAFVPIGYPGVLEIPFFRINMYTASGYFGVITNLVILVILITSFKDNFLKEPVSASESLKDASSIVYRNYESIKDENVFFNDYASAVFMLISFFFCMMSLAILETSATPITMDNFGWSKPKATLINSIILAASGVCCLFVFIGIRFLAKKVKEYILLIIGFILVLFSAILFIPMTNTKIPIFNMTTNSTGCDISLQPWCEYVPALEMWQYASSLSLFTLGYPAVNLLSYVIFSRLIDPNSQSLWMGLLTASGSLARVAGPIFITKLYEHFGTQIAYGSWSGAIFLFLLTTPFFVWKISKTEKKRAYMNLN